MDVVKKIAERMIYGNDTEWNMNIKSFDWVPGVGLYGILTAYHTTKEKNYLDFLNEWAKLYLEDAYTQKTVNSTAPLLTILGLYEITEKPNYLKVCIDIADWIVTHAPLTKDGGLEHTVTEKVEGFSDQIWADTLFMVCIFLAKLGKLTGNESYSDFAVKQLVIHHKLLANPLDGLYYHGWNGAQRNHMSAVYWGRANAWIIYSTMEIIKINDSFEDANEIQAYIKKHAKSLKKWQRSDGTFGTILNDTSSYSEISATAGIIAGIKMAVEQNILDESYLQVYQKGLAAVKAAVTEDGSVSGVSTGTPVMASAQEYKEISIRPTLYGQGLALLALCL